MNGIELVTASGFHKALFKDLPKPAQMAMIQYMAVENDDWDRTESMRQCAKRDAKGMKAAMEASIQEFVAKYGDKEFGVSAIDSEAFKAALVKRSVLPHVKDWESYRKEAAGNGMKAVYGDQDRWPAIIDDEGTFLDGWRRFHSYLASGHPNVPVVFFLPSELI